VAAALRGTAARVLLATRVQDRMFHKAGYTTVELGPEVLAAAQAACDLAGQRRARLHCVVAAGVAVPVRQAAPLALIVNELVTNALRHAFPPDSDGVVRVLLRRASIESAELAVADDGIGFAYPARIDSPDAGAGLGLHLARRLASQAGSRLVIDASGESGAGTRFRLHFAAPDGTTPLAEC
jgi:two-component sensor histidine kinase